MLQVGSHQYQNKFQVNVAVSRSDARAGNDVSEARSSTSECPIPVRGPVSCVVSVSSVVVYDR